MGLNGCEGRKERRKDQEKEGGRDRSDVTALLPLSPSLSLPLSPSPSLSLPPDALDRPNNIRHFRFRGRSRSAATATSSATARNDKQMGRRGPRRRRRRRHMARRREEREKEAFSRSPTTRAHTSPQAGNHVVGRVGQADRDRTV